jgi:glycosyltransferase involved in cell wall biosynthesis
MLAILTTHPIQYQVPLWQRLAADGRVPFEVWYLSEHASRSSRDIEFGREFAWDIDMLKGYPYRILKTPAGATPNTFWRSRITESVPKLFAETRTKVLWVNGWQVAAYWQATWAAHRAGVQVWMRGESNSMAPTALWKRVTKRALLGHLFNRVDHFLCRSYGIPESKLHMAMYAVDNHRFRHQAEAIRGQRSEIRGQWGIPEDAFCVLFCGKFIPKKRPMDLVKAAQLLLASHPELKIHLLFAGSGELGSELRAACHVVYDAEASQRSEVRWQRSAPDNRKLITDNGKPRASFTGFLNQTEVSRAYVAADCLVLPSGYNETWGLVVNEAMASGLRCITSDRCGCAPDLGNACGNAIFSFGNTSDLAKETVELTNRHGNRSQALELPSFSNVVDVVAHLYG